MKINPQQFSAVTSLPGNERYRHFVKVVADWQEVWGLYEEGWALAATDEGTTVFPMWPAREYAEACAVNEWAAYKARSFSLDELLSELLPKLERDAVRPGIFPTPVSKGVTPPISQLRHDLDVELQNY